MDKPNITNKFAGDLWSTAAGVNAGPLDAKTLFTELQDAIDQISWPQRFKGLKFTVLNGPNGEPCEYWWNTDNFRYDPPVLYLPEFTGGDTDWVSGAIFNALTEAKEHTNDSIEIHNNDNTSHIDITTHIDLVEEHLIDHTDNGRHVPTGGNIGQVLKRTGLDEYEWEDDLNEGQIYTAGDFIEIDGTRISAEDMRYDDSEVREAITGISGVLNNVSGVLNNVSGILYDVSGSVDYITNKIENGIYEEGNSIEITNNIISTTHDLSDFEDRITDLESKIDNDDDTKYYPGDYIAIDDENVISVDEDFINMVETASGDIWRISGVVNNVSGKLDILSGNVYTKEEVTNLITSMDQNTEYSAGKYITITGDENSISVSEEFINVVSGISGDLKSLSGIVNNISGDISGIYNQIENGSIYEAGDRITIEGTVISADDMNYDDTEVRNAISGVSGVVNNISGKLDGVSGVLNIISGEVANGAVYEAGENITINGRVISSKDTIYDDTELRVAITGVSGVLNNVSGKVDIISGVLNNVSGDLNILTTTVNNTNEDIYDLLSGISGNCHDTTYTFGPGIIFTSNDFNKVSVDFGEETNQAARGDHTHEGYLTAGDLPGTVNLDGYATETWVDTNFDRKGLGIHVNEVSGNGVNKVLKKTSNGYEWENDIDTIYDDSQLRQEISGLEDSLREDITNIHNEINGGLYEAGDNININGNIISSTGPLYDDDEVRYAISGVSGVLNIVSGKLDNVSGALNITNINLDALSGVVNNVLEGSVYTAGDNITIDGTIISADDMRYDDSEIREAITGISGKVDIISGVLNTISGDVSNILNGSVYTAGDRITIDGTIISADDMNYDDTEVRYAISGVSGVLNIVSGNLSNLEIRVDTLETDVTNINNQISVGLYEAGQYIEINNNVISSTGPIYDDSDILDRISGVENSITNILSSGYDDTNIQNQIDEINTLIENGTIYTAGNNITISGRVISSKDTTYSEGNYITISGDENSISVSEEFVELVDAISGRVEIVSGVLTAVSGTVTNLSGDLNNTNNILSGVSGNLSNIYNQIENGSIYEAGENIAINNNIISASGYDDTELRIAISGVADSITDNNTKYYGGSGIIITQNDSSGIVQIDQILLDRISGMSGLIAEFSDTNTEYFEGSNITISSSNVISVSDSLIDRISTLEANEDSNTVYEGVSGIIVTHDQNNSSGTIKVDPALIQRIEDISGSISNFVDTNTMREPATSTTNLNFGFSGIVGTSLNFAREDHTHGLSDDMGCDCIWDNPTPTDITVGFLEAGTILMGKNAVEILELILYGVNPTPIVSVTSVNVTPPSVTIDQGGNQTFSAVVNGFNNPPQGVNWSLIGNLPQTTINSSGYLFVYAHQPAGNNLKVVATSVFDSTVSGMASVTVNTVHSEEDLWSSEFNLMDPQSPWTVEVKAPGFIDSVGGGSNFAANEDFLWEEYDKNKIEMWCAPSMGLGTWHHETTGIRIPCREWEPDASPAIHSANGCSLVAWSLTDVVGVTKFRIHGGLNNNLRARFKWVRS